MTMDYSNALGIEYRVVNEIVYEGNPARVVGGARNYDAEPAELWDALTNVDRLPRWFAPVTGDLELGGRYQIEGNAGGKITRCDPPHELNLTWEYSQNISWVTVRLEPFANGTRLTLEHVMRKDEASESHWKKYGPGSTGVGWDYGFLSMGLHLESGGKAVLDDGYDAWMVSESGKSFVRDCARAWGEAHVESGESRATAVAMAGQTAKAYTGEE